MIGIRIGYYNNVILYYDLVADFFFYVTKQSRLRRWLFVPKRESFESIIVIGIKYLTKKFLYSFILNYIILLICIQFNSVYVPRVPTGSHYMYKSKRTCLR